MVKSVPMLPPAPTPDTGFVRSADGIDLALDLEDAGNRAPIVFAHGFGQTRQAWSATARRLSAAGHPTLSFDARGHGESGRNPADLPYRGEQFVDDLALATRHLVARCGRTARSVRPPVLIGASMGGLLGLLAQARDAPFSALVLVDVTPRWERDGHERILGFMNAHPDGFDSLEHAADVIAAYLPHRGERKSAAQLRALLREGADRRWRWHWDPRLLAEFAGAMTQHQDVIAEAARRIRVPTLLISGGRSDLVSERTVAEFLALVPHARHARLPQATHMVAGDDNDAFTAAILQFMTEIDDRSVHTSNLDARAATPARAEEARNL